MITRCGFKAFLFCSLLSLRGRLGWDFLLPPYGGGPGWGFLRVGLLAGFLSLPLWGGLGWGSLTVA